MDHFDACIIVLSFLVTILYYTAINVPSFCVIILSSTLTGLLSHCCKPIANPNTAATGHSSQATRDQVSRNESKYWNVTAASKTAIKSVALLTTLIWSRCPAFMWMEVQVKWPNGRRSLSVQPGHRQWKITGPKTDHQTRPCMVSDIAAWTGVCYQNVIILQSI